MIKQLIFLGLAFYFKNNNHQLGLQMLMDNTELKDLPEEFLLWWEQNKSSFALEVDGFIKQGINFTYPGCSDYPNALLTHLEDAPLFLTYIGKPCWINNFCLSIVGSRKISPSTKEWMNEDLMQYLIHQKVCVVSGGARGVDQQAHFCALRAKSPTLVFLPSGLNQMYPSDLNSWKNDILNSGGAFMSEYWPTECMKKHYFIQRNRLIAAIAHFVLVTQGELRSGTLLTAQWAINLGRNVGVLPGHPKDGMFSGNLNLLRAGVPPIIDVEDLKLYCQTE